MDEESSTGISLLRMAGVVIGDNCGSEKIVAGMAVTSERLCRVSPLLGMGCGIGLAADEISPMSDPIHGAAISGGIVAKVGHWDTSKT